MYKGEKCYLLQNASHIPLALTGLKFFASLTSTCNEPFDDDDVDDELRELVDDFMLPNLRNPLLIDDREKCDIFESDGTYLRPTIISPRYVDRSSNGSLCGKENMSKRKKKDKKKKSTSQKRVHNIINKKKYFQ